MVKRNADGTLKILGRLPDPDWIDQVRAQNEAEDETEEGDEESEPEA